MKAFAARLAWRPVEWHDAVEMDGEGCAILLEVMPGGRTQGFPTGYNEWRNRIGIKVHAQPQAGKANKEVESEVARFFGVPPARVRIESGHADNRKRVAISGLSREAAIARLAGAIGDDG